MATTNKNSMLPTYQGNYNDMIGALKFGDITNPCWFWIEDRNDLAFIHWEKDSKGNKTLVPHVMLWDKFEKLDDNVTEINSQLEDLKDPEGKPIKVVEYVEVKAEDTLEQAKNYTNTALKITVV